MTSPSTAAKERAASGRRSSTNVAAFVFGLPLAACILGFIIFGPVSAEAKRYVQHPVEKAEVVLFSCAVCALIAKLWRSRRERAAFRTSMIPGWDGKAIPVTEAGSLLTGLNRVPMRLRDTYLVRRVANVLEFLCSRGSANQLDDQLRALADTDSVALEGGYSLIRFITWATPILGFLGTVLGITGAISGVTPEALERSLSTVTDGLSEAFDTTALALGLTMVTMFLSFLVDRREQGILEQVDQFADRQLAHRFERTGGEGGEAIDVMRQNTAILLQGTEQLVRRQAELWAQTMQASEQQRLQSQTRQQETLTKSLELALERTMQSHARRVAGLEKETANQNATLLQAFTTMNNVLQATSREQRESLAQVATGITEQAAVLSRLQDGEKQLIRLQETLQQNLATLAGAGAFEEAVQSLTAAVHLLTARAAVLPIGGAGRGSLRPGAAA